MNLFTLGSKYSFIVASFALQKPRVQKASGDVIWDGKLSYIPEKKELHVSGGTAN